jgi:hypothetical protein
MEIFTFDIENGSDGALQMNSGDLAILKDNIDRGPMCGEEWENDAGESPTVCNIAAYYCAPPVNGNGVCC